MTAASVVVPAHNEERVLPRLLTGLLEGAEPDELEVIVVANGCTDRTAEVAREVPGVLVIETPVASKGHALELGDDAASAFPRLYVDADVELGIGDVRALVEALRRPGVLAVGPVRDIPMDGVATVVRWYYDVWQRLPGIDDLFGRGVIAISQTGHARLSDWSDVMSDDLLTAMSFDRAETLVVEGAAVVIRPPRTIADLLRRRTRAITGNAMLAATAPAGMRPPPRTGLRDLARITLGDPRLAPKAAVFVAVAVMARARARRATRRADTSWLRDDSSRA